MCHVCLLHKLMMRDLAHHLLARESQRRLYVRHLEAQYLDRTNYWRARSISRMKAGEVVLIADSMDQAKFVYPRSQMFRAKDLAGLQRPKAHITAVVAHGHFTFFSVSAQDVPKDSTTMIEILSHSLTLLQKKGVELHKTAVTIQSDNTSREFKNNPVVKWMASLVANNIVPKISLKTLRTGHSHEDIDQIFGRLASHMVKHARHASGPHDFRTIIQSWLDSKLDRPHELGRHAVILDQCRDWKLS